MIDEVSFREKIVALRIAFVNDRYNSDRSKDFWYVMDSISDELVIKWTERALKIKNPIHEPWNSNEWMQCCNIVNYFKTYDKNTEMPWTKAQKRFCTFQIIKFWDDLEGIYYCC